MKNPLARKDYKELIPLYFRAKELIATAEREDTEQRISLSAVAELRSALDHIMRVDNVLAGLVTVEQIERESGIAANVYLERNISKAAGHLYRASYDAYDVIGIRLLDETEKLLADVSVKALYSVIPTAHEKISLPFDTAKKLLTAAKIAKDVQNREEEQMRFEEYESAINALADVRDFIGERMDVLIKFDYEDKKRESRNIKIAISIAIVSLLAGAALSFLSGILF